MPIPPVRKLPPPYMAQVILSAISRNGNINHSADNAMRSKRIWLVVFFIPSARERARFSHAIATPDKTKSSNKSITKSNKGLCAVMPFSGTKYLKKTCPCRGTHLKPR